MGYFQILFNEDGTIHECEWENKIEEIDLKEVPPDLIKQYEERANEPSKLSRKHTNFLRYKRERCLTKKKSGKYGSKLQNQYWKNKLREEKHR